MLKLFSKKEGPRRIKKDWGYIEELAEGENWRVDKLVITPGASDKLHAQPSCRHYCYVAQGSGRIWVGPKRNQVLHQPVVTEQEFVIDSYWLHRFENTGKTNLVIIQHSIGKWDLDEMVESL